MIFPLFEESVVTFIVYNGQGILWEANQRDRNTESYTSRRSTKQQETTQVLGDNWLSNEAAEDLDSKFVSGAAELSSWL